MMMVYPIIGWTDMASFWGWIVFTNMIPIMHMDLGILPCRVNISGEKRTFPYTVMI